YVSERDLGKVHPGMASSVAVDSFPDRRFGGWVGFISPVAEFTPKAVQTAELRTSLVYTDANHARIIQSYAQAAVGQWAAQRAAEGREIATGPVLLRERLWFNEANESRYFLVPGLIVLIMTLIGALLTALVMAREWERAPWKPCSSRRSRPMRSCWGR